MIAGTALIHVIDRRPMSSQKAVRWNRSSSTRLEPATSVDSRPTTSALMWKSGSGLKPRSSGPSSRCDATQRAVWSSLFLAQPDDLGRSGRARRGQDDAAGAGALGAVAPGRVTGPSSRCSRRSSSTQYVAHVGRGGPIRHHHVRAGARHGGGQAARSRPRAWRGRAARPRTRRPWPRGRRRRRPRVADGETDGGEPAGAGAAEPGPPPLHAPLQLAEGQRPPVTGVLDVGPIAQGHRAGRE